jgi:hypothetical protein
MDHGPKFMLVQTPVVENRVVDAFTKQVVFASKDIEEATRELNARNGARDE